MVGASSARLREQMAFRNMQSWRNLDGAARLFRFRWTIVLVLATVNPAHSQWLNYHSPGIPRLTDGSPNLAAPAPRSSDGKPDLSGIWRSELVENGVSYHLNIARDLQRVEVRPWAEAVYRDRMRNFQKEAPWFGDQGCRPNTSCVPAEAIKRRALTSPPGTATSLPLG
jgi:hypothetical protein